VGRNHRAGARAIDIQKEADTPNYIYDEYMSLGVSPNAYRTKNEALVGVFNNLQHKLDVVNKKRLELRRQQELVGHALLDLRPPAQPVPVEVPKTQLPVSDRREGAAAA
jgi:hypothetical protein